MSVQELIEKYTREIEDNERQISYYQSHSGDKSEDGEGMMTEVLNHLSCELYVRAFEYKNNILKEVIDNLRECIS